MKTLLFLSLILTSYQSFALTCKNTLTGNQIEITKDQDKYNAELILNNETVILSGKKYSITSIDDHYLFFSDEGVEYSFITTFFISGSHCRARVCNTPITSKKGKLISQESGNEYFNCL